MDIKGYLSAPVPRWVAITAIVSASVASAAVTGLVMDRRFNRLFDEKVSEEVYNTTKFLRAIRKDEYPTATDAGAALLPESADDMILKTDVSDMIESLRYTSDAVRADIAEEEMTEVSHNVFTDAKFEVEWDEEAELEKRDTSKPYIISYDEFNETEFQQASLAWFDGDEVLADDKDEYVPNPDAIIGLENLSRFGHGSNDPNIVYVRNESLDTDFEITRSDGKFVEQVHGFIQHDDRRVIRKMRDYDE